jgi:hypothetical protein
MDNNNQCGIREILVRIQIQIHGSAPLTNGSDLYMASDPDPTPDPTPFIGDFKDAKNVFHSFFLQGTLRIIIFSLTDPDPYL